MHKAPIDTSVDEASIAERVLPHFDEILKTLAEASPLLRAQHVIRLLSQVDVLTDSRAGFEFLRRRISDMDAAGVFAGGPWESPERQVPALAPGTLKAGGQSTLMEILSELRLLAIAEGEIQHPTFPVEQAHEFIQEVLVNSLELLFPDGTEEGRGLAPELRAKIDHHMWLLLERFTLDGIKGALATEIELICLQRPIVTDRAQRLISLVRREVELKPGETEDLRLLRFVDAVACPSPEAGSRTLEEYARFLEDADWGTLERECRHLSGSMLATGLAVGPHAVLARAVAASPELVAQVLGLSPAGRAELEKHHAFVQELIDETIHAATARAVHGLGRLVDRGILSQQPVRTGLERIRSMELHPKVEETILRSRPGSELTARQILLADCLCVLGQPLGVGQGRNPTCQSARGISLWSRHAPGKLLEMIRTVARADDLHMRFEGAVIRSSEAGVGLLQEHESDLDLDAVSVILVPHLDRIYNEMMRRAAHRSEDPHKWVNPAMYGHWIPTGFQSAYDAITGAIRDYPTFLRTFYATHHPDFNRGHDLAYPNPVGIFLTSASGALIGFHAVSILRVRRFGRLVRVYILNPNSEGRQRWHADISPTVAGYGEEPGESSLPFDQFASRIYAFHFNPSDIGELAAVDDDTIARVENAARSSWGLSYQWVQ